MARDLRADLYHLHDPELIPVALALKRAGHRVVYDAHEEAPMEAWSMNRGRPMRRATLPILWWSLLRLARLRLDAFVAATPRIAGGFPSGRTIEVRNYPRVEMFPDVYDAATRRRDLVFAGLVSEQRGAMQMLDVMSHVGPKHQLRLKLFGTIENEKLATRMRSHAGWGWVDYLGHRPWPEVLASYRTALAGFLLYEETAEQRWCMPVKLFEFLLSGLPVIATDLPFWQTLLEENPNVHFVRCADVASIRQQVEWLLENPEQLAHKARSGVLHARARFDWTQEGERLVGLYDRLLEC